MIEILSLRVFPQVGGNFKGSIYPGLAPENTADLHDANHFRPVGFVSFRGWH